MASTATSHAKLLRFGSPLLLAACALVITPAHAQDAEPSTGCVLHKDVYTCNLQSFGSALSSAHTARIETQRMDRSTQAQLRHLVTSLGKTVVPEDQPADLTFLLIPIDPTGVSIGPAARDLATLRIYAPGPNGQRGTLLWAETYRGQPDRSWPATVDALIQQFQSRLNQR